VERKGQKKVVSRVTFSAEIKRMNCQPVIAAEVRENVAPLYPKKKGEKRQRKRKSLMVAGSKGGLSRKGNYPP